MAAICDIGLIALLINSVVGSITISFNELDITDIRDTEAVRVIEGDHILLRCKTEYQNATLSWHRNSAVILNASLAIHDVHVQDTGIYICRVTGVNISESKNVYVEVLYPLSYPVIEGTSSGLIGEPVNLKCISDGNPEPTYEWRLEDVDGRVLTRNQSYQTTIPYDGYALVCKVQSLMVTTIGKPRRDTLSLPTSIRTYIKAYIQHELGGYHWRIPEGTHVNIYCAVAGKPNPVIWWTKVGNGTFRYEGHRLKEYNTGIDFAGDYVCHAENTVITVNKTVITTHVTKAINITIIESPPTVDLACKSEECSSCCNQSPETTTAHTSTKMYTRNTQITPAYSSKTEQSLFILSGIGWTALVVSVVMNVWLCRKNRMIGKNVKENIHAQAANQTQDSSFYSRALPAPPSYIQEVRISENTYTDLSNYYQINSDTDDSLYPSALDSNGTVQSTVTYMEPTLS